MGGLAGKNSKPNLFLAKSLLGPPEKSGQGPPNPGDRLWQGMIVCITANIQKRVLEFILPKLLAKNLKEISKKPHSFESQKSSA